MQTETPTAKGFNTKNGLSFIYDDDNDILHPLDVETAFSESLALNDVIAFGYYKQENDKYKWFLIIRRSDNDIEAEDSISITAGGITATLTKQDALNAGVIHYTSAELNAEPTPNDNTLAISVGGKDYEFEAAQLSRRTSKAYAECEIYEIGCPSPAKQNDVRTIGGNDYDLGNSTAKDFLAAHLVNYRAATVSADDIYLANENTISRVYKDALANNPILDMNGTLPSIRDIITRFKYMPGDFSRADPGVLYAYLKRNTTGGETNLSDRLTSDQGNSLKDYLSNEVYRIQANYSQTIQSIRGGDADITDIVASFSGEFIYATAKGCNIWS